MLLSAVFVFKLLYLSSIKARESQVVLLVVDYSQQNSLFDQMKNALQKIHGHQVTLNSIRHDRVMQ